MWVKAPYWRSDITIEDDVVEEIARIVGYESIPTTTLSAPIPHHEPNPFRDMRERIRDVLVSLGMHEVISYSLTDRETLDKVEVLSNGPEPIGVANPMSREQEYLRTSLRGSILKTLASNRRTSQGEGVRIFEIGRIYLPREEAKIRALPDEKETLIGVVSGPRFDLSWLAGRGDMDFFDAKGLLESLFGQVGARTVYEATNDPIMHPGKAARVLCDGRAVGVIGEIHPRVLGRFDLDDSPVAMFEIDLESLCEALPEDARRYTSTTRFPESERDLALIVDAAVPSARIQSVIQRNKLVKRTSPFDLYSGQGIPAGKKSIAYRTVFQSPIGTLTTEQVNSAQSDILRQLQREFGAELRG